MTDWHSHILPGLDDGARTDSEAVLMATALAEAGFIRVCCTPHCIRGIYETGADQVREATEKLQQQVRKVGVDLTLVPGMEYLADENLLDAVADPLLLPGNLLLVEIPSGSDPVFIAGMMHQLLRRKVTPLIAHPERCDLFFPPDPMTVTNSSLLRTLRDIGCIFQGNRGSFAGFYGRRVKEAALALHAAGVYSRFGNDLHSLSQCRNLAEWRLLPAC